MFEVYFITDRRIMKNHFMKIITAVARAGAEMIQVREKDLSDAELFALTKKVLSAARPHGTKVLVNSRWDIAKTAKADGVHLNANGIPVGVVRKEAGKNFLIGYSAHSLSEAIAVRKEGADFITYSPIFKTRKPFRIKPKGILNLKIITRKTGIPVYALGGINARNVGKLANAGIRGVAVISAVAKSQNPSKAIIILKGENYA